MKITITPLSKLVGDHIQMSELRTRCGITHTAFDDELEENAYAAAQYIELRCDCILLASTVTAEFQNGESIELRGPVNTIASVKDGNGNDVAYSLIQRGYRTRIEPTKSQTGTVLVVYNAGNTELNPLERVAIKSWVVSKIQNRGTATATPLTEPPHGFSDIVNALRRGGFIG